MVSHETLVALREFETALLANTLGYMDAPSIDEAYMGGSIKSLTPELGPTVGIAVTCRIDSSTPGGEADLARYWEQVDRMATEPLPMVWVAEMVGSRPDHECTGGDGMAKAMYATGCLGVVTNGYFRDIAGCLTVPFAVHARGTIAHHCVMRIVETDTPVQVGGVTVNPGDIIHADREGVLKIPEASADLLVQRTPDMRALEFEAHTFWRQANVPAAEKTKRVSELLKRRGFC